MSTRWRLAVLAGLFALVTACGGGGDDGGDGVASIVGHEHAELVARRRTTSASPTGPDAGVREVHARARRRHGGPGGRGAGGGIGIVGGGAGEKEKVDKANAACKKLLPNGGEPPKPSAEDLDKMRKQAKCLREHGIDVQGPDHGRTRASQIDGPRRRPGEGRQGHGGVRAGRGSISMGSEGERSSDRPARDAQAAPAALGGGRRDRAGGAGRRHGGRGHPVG